MKSTVQILGIHLAGKKIVSMSDPAEMLWTRLMLQAPLKGISVDRLTIPLIS
jgi:hypothetical protein